MLQKSVNQTDGAKGKSAHGAKKYRVTHCTRTSPLPLLPSGPGGVGGITSRRTPALIDFITGRLSWIAVVRWPFPFQCPLRLLVLHFDSSIPGERR